MKLGFVTGRPARVRGTAVSADAGLGRFVDALKTRSGGFSAAFATSGQRGGLFDHEMAISPQECQFFPELPSVRQGFFKFMPCRRVIHEIEAQSDVVVFQLPFPTPFALPAKRRPRVYHVCADVTAIAKANVNYQGVTRIMANVIGATIEQTQQWAANEANVRIVAHGQSLLTQLGGETRGRAIVSSTLYNSEIDSLKRTRPRDDRFRMLFVGYLRPEKGFDVLLDAFDALLRAGEDIELEIVGAEPADDRGTMSQLMARVRPHVDTGRVRFLGHRPFGPELFACFANADVLVLPSLSEGTPRVLVEARAFRCPVIASDVGGIPSSVTHEHDGLLFTVGDPRALARAVTRVKSDANLRHRLIVNGLERARNSTVSAMADAIFDEAERALSGGGIDSIFHGHSHNVSHAQRSSSPPESFTENSFAKDVLS